MMIFIMTALADPKLNERLKEEKEFYLIGNDIQYQEGIFELLEKEEKINYLIISELLPGNLSIKELLLKIKEKNKNINIILFLEKQQEELEKELKLLGIYKIFYHNQIEIKELISILNNEENTKEQLENEIKLLREILIKNNISIEEKKDEKNAVISILGTGGVGKSIITINMANILAVNKNKVLIIDFDILNNSLHTILNVEKYSQKIKKRIKENNLLNPKINIKDLIIKINKKIDLISGINLIFDSKYKISSSKINAIINEIKQYYNYIIIDTTSECFFDYTKNLIENSDLCLFLLESNLSEIKKAKNLLAIYSEQWKINKNKIQLIINKYNENAIDEHIIKNIFSEFKIIGKIKFSKKYNLYINQNETILSNNEIKKEYQTIYQKIGKEKKYGKCITSQSNQ